MLWEYFATDGSVEINLTTFERIILLKWERFSNGEYFGSENSYFKSLICTVLLKEDTVPLGTPAHQALTEAWLQEGALVSLIKLALSKDTDAESALNYFY